MVRLDVFSEIFEVVWSGWMFEMIDLKLVYIFIMFNIREEVAV